MKSRNYEILKSTFVFSLSALLALSGFSTARADSGVCFDPNTREFRFSRPMTHAEQEAINSPYGPMPDSMAHARECRGIEGGIFGSVPESNVQSDPSRTFQYPQYDPKHYSNRFPDYSKPEKPAQEKLQPPKLKLQLGDPK